MGKLEIKVLSDNEIELMHRRTLDVFEKVGFRITHDEAIKKFAKAGAKVDKTSGNIRLSPEMVKELLDLAPSIVTCPRFMYQVL